MLLQSIQVEVHDSNAWSACHGTSLTHQSSSAVQTHRRWMALLVKACWNCKEVNTVSLGIVVPSFKAMVPPSTCSDLAGFANLISWSLLKHFSGGRYLIVLVSCWCIVCSSNGVAGSRGPSIAMPESLSQMSFRRDSFPARGIFLGWVTSDPGPSREFFNACNVKAWLSKCNRLMAARPPTVTGPPTTWLTAVVMAALSTVVPGWLTQ